jgi:hypothetical protein
MENLVATEVIASELKKHGLNSDLYPQNDGIYMVGHPLDLIAESVRDKEKRLTAIYFVAIGETLNDRSSGVLKRFEVSVKSDAPKAIATIMLRTYRRVDREFASYFRGIKAQRPQLFQRLESAGYFSVPNAPSRDLVRDEQSQMTIKECRQHVREVERFAARYRRTPPRDLRSALANNYRIASVEINHLTRDGRSIQGMALLEECDGLRRKFLIPVKSQLRRLVFGKPRNWKDFEWYRDKVMVPANNKRPPRKPSPVIAKKG